MANNNPQGKNQYTGRLRLKTGKFYHGTAFAFASPVKPDQRGDKVWATSDLKKAKLYSKQTGNHGRNVPRVLQVALASRSKVRELGSHRGVKVASAKQPMRVIRTLPTLHKPSRRK